MRPLIFLSYLLTLIFIEFNAIHSFPIILPEFKPKNAIARSSLVSSEEIQTTIQKQSQLRRSFLKNTIVSTLITNTIIKSKKAIAADSSNEEITDKIFLTIKGITNDPTSTERKRIVIGLFGKTAPKSTSILKQLVSKSTGYKTSCKPRPTRLLEREQLEADKVYNNCIANEEQFGVTYEGSTVWRVVKNQRIDVGAVVGKYLSRENPYFDDDSNLRHDVPGVVSVRRGNDGGFGFTIHYYDQLSKDVVAAQDALNQDNIVIGRVIEGLDVVEELNNLPVVKSASVNYMGLTGGPTVKNEAAKNCRYGGPLYCNENKPLRKVQIVDCGVL